MENIFTLSKNRNLEVDSKNRFGKHYPRRSGS